jgi:Reverse transcriptase (RNA-dependent DNA polymerase)
MPADFVVAKLDFSNAFNSLHRDKILEMVYSKLPELYQFCLLAYGQHSFLSFGSDLILSEEGAQQGDPLGPLLFCLAVQALLLSLSSMLTLGYMDDFTLGGPEKEVSADVELIIKKGTEIGLNLNLAKCELISAKSFTCSSSVLSSFIRVPLEDSTLLGAPLVVGSALDSMLAERCEELSRAVERLKLIDSHDALILLRSSFSAPKIQHLLRCSPCVGHKSLELYDGILKTGIRLITNTELSETQWLQASLPVKDGGLGVRRATSLALPSFLASAASTSALQSQILQESNFVSGSSIEKKYRDLWSTWYSTPALDAPLSFKQGAWDRPYLLSAKASVLESVTGDAYNSARLAAVSAPHSGDWLHALPIASCGLKLDNEAIRVAVGLRLGVDLCISHNCPCGLLVDTKGSHSLSCKLACGRMIRHFHLNDVIYRALASADIPASKEPSGLLRSDGKRPDGLTLIPWQAGRSLTWDVTVSHTAASSYLSNVAATAGGVAEMAAERKREKYVELEKSYIFQPISFETFGPINSSGHSFISEIGRRISAISGDVRETAFLYQRLSVTVQRFNAIAFRGCFIAADLDS